MRELLLLTLVILASLGNIRTQPSETGGEVAASEAGEAAASTTLNVEGVEATGSAGGGVSVDIGSAAAVSETGADAAPLVVAAAGAEAGADAAPAAAVAAEVAAPDAAVTAVDDASAVVVAAEAATSDAAATAADAASAVVVAAEGAAPDAAVAVDAVKDAAVAAVAVKDAAVAADAVKDAAVAAVAVKDAAVAADAVKDAAVAAVAVKDAAVAAVAANAVKDAAVAAVAVKDAAVAADAVKDAAVAAVAVKDAAVAADAVKDAAVAAVAVKDAAVAADAVKDAAVAAVAVKDAAVAADAVKDAAVAAVAVKDAAVAADAVKDAAVAAVAVKDAAVAADAVKDAAVAAVAVKDAAVAADAVKDAAVAAVAVKDAAVAADAVKDAAVAAVAVKDAAVAADAVKDAAVAAVAVKDATVAADAATHAAVAADAATDAAVAAAVAVKDAAVAAVAVKDAAVAADAATDAAVAADAATDAAVAAAVAVKDAAVAADAATDAAVAAEAIASEASGTAAATDTEGTLNIGLPDGSEASVGIVTDPVGFEVDAGALPDAGGVVVGALPDAASLDVGPVGALPDVVGLASGTSGALPDTSGLASGPSGALPDTSGLASGPSGVLPITTGLASGPSGALPITTGLASGPSGALPITTGLASGPSGALPITTGLASGPSGALPITTGLASGPSGALPDAGGVVLDASPDPAGDPAGGLSVMVAPLDLNPVVAASCVMNPCQNGGTCSLMLDQVMCQCAAGFTGINCETAIRDPSTVGTIDSGPIFNLGTVDTGPSEPTEPFFPATIGDQEGAALCVASNCTQKSCYISNPNDCKSYYVCTQQRGSLYRAEKMNCPFGTLWHPTAWSCEKPEAVSCPTDPCRTSERPYSPRTRNCRAYWECDRRMSKPSCCPPLHSFNEAAGQCVFDLSCKTACPLISEGCRKQGVMTQPFFDGNCKTHWDCAAGFPHPICCPKGQGYNTKAERCEDMPSCKDKCHKEYTITCAKVGGAEGKSLSYKLYRKDQNCRVFMQCTTDGHHLKSCCMQGSFYNNVTQACEEHPDPAGECAKTQCPEGYFEECRLQPVKGNPKKYFNTVANMERDCAPGSYFSVFSCTCVHAHSTAETCKWGVNTDFSSRNDGKIDNMGDGFLQPYGAFDRKRTPEGVNYLTYYGDSGFLAWKYNHVQFPEATLKITFQPVAEGTSKRILVSNCGSTRNPNLPSFEVYLNPVNSTVVFYGETETNSAIAQILYNKNGWNRLELYFNGEYVMLKISDPDIGQGDTVTSVLKGKILPGNEPMKFGPCFVNGKPNNNGFIGFVTETLFSNCLNNQDEEILLNGIRKGMAQP